MSQEKVVETFDRWAENGRDVGMEEEMTGMVGIETSLSRGKEVDPVALNSSSATRLTRPEPSLES